MLLTVYSSQKVMGKFSHHENRIVIRGLAWAYAFLMGMPPWAADKHAVIHFIPGT